MFNYAIVIASDSRSTGDKQDLCSQEIKKLMDTGQYSCIYESIIPDDLEGLKAEMMMLADEKQVDLIITSGGTGLSPRDNTPEATKAIISKEVPGIAMAMALASKEKTHNWMLSRATSGIRGKTLIINLPGSPKAVRECLEAVLPALYHGLEILNQVVTDHD